MPQVMVRVKPGERLRENGATYVEGQTLWVPLERIRDIMDQVDEVKGVAAPAVRTTAIDSPRPVIGPVDMPQPDVRLLAPRDAEEDASGDDVQPVEEMKKPKPKKPYKKGK